MPLAFLAPDLVEMILAGKQPATLTPSRLLDARLPYAWAEQRALSAAPEAGKPARKEVAAFFGVNPDTPDQWRLRGDGPRFFQPPGTRRVWYAELEVLRWAASGAKQSTSEYAAA